MQIPPRQRVRVTPPKPITVSIDDKNGLAMGYGVLANVSEAGACFWTDCQLEPGGELLLRVSFSHPAEVHEVAAEVVWTAEERHSSGTSMRRYGLQWRRLSFPYLLRLRELARERGETPSGSRPAVSRAPLLDPC